MLTTTLSLPDARIELQKVFGNDYENDVWAMCCKINDMDPDEWDERTSEIAKELEAKMGLVEDSAMTSETVKELEAKMGLVEDAAMISVDETSTYDKRRGRRASNYSGTTTQDYQIFAIRCMRGSETEAVEKIWADFEANKIHPSVLRGAFKSRYPRSGYIYIQAHSMLPKNTKLAAYLRTVPGLIYRRFFKYRYPNENAWSQKSQKVKRQPLPAVESNDLIMPICLRVEDIRFNREGVETAYQGDVDDDLEPSTVQGDFGIIVQDNYGETDSSVHALLQVIPRIKFPGSRTRPPKAPIPVDFNLSPPIAWQSFIASKQVTVSCIEKGYNPGGFVLMKVKLYDLDVALQVPDDELAVFEMIADGDPLGNVPPPTSWTFQEKETGIFQTGTEGVIEKVCNLVCEVAFLYQGQGLGIWSVAQRNLVKKLASGQTVRVAPGISSLQGTEMDSNRRLGVFMHPLHGPSLGSISHLNKVSHPASRPISFSICDKSLVPSDITICDIRDISVIQRTQSLREDKAKNLEILNPEEYFARQGSRKSGRQVKEVVPDVEDRSKFFVLIEWNKSSIDSGPFFDWCPYEIVRRSDNLGLLHEFTPYTGNSPWKGFRVKVIKKGVYKDREAWVLDSRINPVLDRDTVSGMSVHLYFEDGMMVQENRTAWINYDSIRRSDIKPM
ncbi:hypothetical protein BT96DRAFT_1007154 [Gymnopus androsaceus JB14]|uniref:Uncharacterized protein n=1 Tax=Gymnopus androsaceus JB14 TaxID=1447944 RepID=A0A6A4GJ90_9AGAR|nr:hypothetical protein BT96DRAFT_1007154 [Gymnopus androsaceus JB14]